MGFAFALPILRSLNLNPPMMPRYTTNISDNYLLIKQFFAVGFASRIKVVCPLFSNISEGINRDEQPRMPWLNLMVLNLRLGV